MKNPSIIVKETGEKKIAIYAPNTSGNMRYNVDGKFYSDKQFNKLFEIVNEDSKLIWRSHLRNLFDEILLNAGTQILHKPLQITINIIAEAAQYAAEINDEKMIAYFVRLAIYTFSDPTNLEEFDQERTDYYLNKLK